MYLCHRQPQQGHHARCIEYRVRLYCRFREMFQPGILKHIETTTLITRKPGQLSMLLKPDEKMSSSRLIMRNEGIVTPAFRGRMSILMQNITNNEIITEAGTPIGYIILSPFVM